MMKIKPATKFKKDLKKFKHNNPVIKELDILLKMLVRGEALPAKYQDHFLSGNWDGHRECHIKPDVLLIYHVNKKDNLLTLERIGSHAELFN